MIFKIGDYVTLTNIKHPFDYVHSGVIYRIRDLLPYVRLVYLDDVTHAYPLEHFEKVDLDSLTKLEKALYNII